MPPGIGYGLTGPRQPPFRPPPHWMSAEPLQGPLDTPQGLQQAINVGVRGPSGLTALLQKPGLRDALMATGSALLAQSDQPGSLGGALGRALPMGMQAYQQGQQEAAINEAIKGAPPEMRKLLQGLRPDQRGMAALQLLQPMAQPDPVVVGDALVDPTSGTEIYRAEDEEDYTYRDLPDGRVGVFSGGQLVNAFGDVPPPEVDYDDVSGLRREFNSQIETFDEISEAYQKVEAAGTKESPTGADDVSLVFGYMKIVDPGSTVREGEQATAREAAGVPDRVVALYNRLVSGEQLAPEQRRNFVQAARELAQSQVPLFQQRAGYYRGIAERNNFNPSDVIRNPFEGTGLLDGQQQGSGAVNYDNFLDRYQGGGR